MAEATTKSRSKAKSNGDKKPARPRRSAKSRAVEEHARSYFQAFADRDPDAMAAHWSEDGIEDMVPVAVLRGPDHLKRFFGELFAAVPDSQVTVQRVVADDRHAVVEWRMTGTFSGGPFQGIEPNGRHVELRGADILEIEDGRILRNTVYYDGASFARQVGMLPPQDSGAERAMKGAFNALTKVRKAVEERRGAS